MYLYRNWHANIGTFAYPSILCLALISPNQPAPADQPYSIHTPGTHTSPHAHSYFRLLFWRVCWPRLKPPRQICGQRVWQNTRLSGEASAGNTHNTALNWNLSESPNSRSLTPDTYTYSSYNIIFSYHVVFFNCIII